MEDIWSSEDFSGFLAGKKKDKKKNKKKNNKNKTPGISGTPGVNVYADPAGIASDPMNTFDKSRLKTIGQCQECGNYDIGVNPLRSSQGEGKLCRRCKKDPDIAEKHSHECELCSQTALPDEKYCPKHTKKCEECGDQIDDIGEFDNNTEILDDETRCKNCRDHCETCGKPVTDQDDHPDSLYCEDHRKKCENCSDEIYDQDDVDHDENYCENCRVSCPSCGESIKDAHDHYDMPEVCENCRPACKECGDNIKDPSVSDEYCEDCRKHCEDCSDLIYDQSDYPYSDYCEDCRHNCYNCGDHVDDYDDVGSAYCHDCRNHCKDCGSVIYDQDSWPDSEKCEDHREICRETPNHWQEHEIDDIDSDEYNKAKLEHDTDGNPLNEYCSDHRHRCRICGDNVPDYYKVKDEIEGEHKPVVPVEKSQQIGTHPSDLSSMQYQDVANPKYLSEGEQKPDNDWYNLCSSCRHYIKEDWKP